MPRAGGRRKTPWRENRFVFYFPRVHLQWCTTAIGRTRDDSLAKKVTVGIVGDWTRKKKLPRSSNTVSWYHGSVRAVWDVFSLRVRQTKILILFPTTLLSVWSVVPRTNPPDKVAFQRHHRRRRRTRK